MAVLAMAWVVGGDLVYVWRLVGSGCRGYGAWGRGDMHRVQCVCMTKDVIKG